MTEWALFVVGGGHGEVLAECAEGQTCVLPDERLMAHLAC